MLTTELIGRFHPLIVQLAEQNIVSEFATADVANTPEMIAAIQSINGFLSYCQDLALINFPFECAKS